MNSPDTSLQPDQPYLRRKVVAGLAAAAIIVPGAAIAMGSIGSGDSARSGDQSGLTDKAANNTFYMPKGSNPTKVADKLFAKEGVTDPTHAEEQSATDQMMGLNGWDKDDLTKLPEGRIEVPSTQALQDIVTDNGEPDFIDPNVLSGDKAGPEVIRPQ